MSEMITRAEHDEFAKRMEDEHARQNHRIASLEEAVEKYGALTIAVERMAVTMEKMLEEQKRQGTCIEELESRDGEMWRKATAYVVTAILGIIIGYLFKQLGM